jgi:rare lipoprotein A
MLRIIFVAALACLLTTAAEASPVPKDNNFLAGIRSINVTMHRDRTCKASFYHEGQLTANGEHFKPDGLTAAHRTLPFGTNLRVSYGSRSVVVRINDRGPAKWTGRCIDLSRGAARVLGFLNAGVVTVTFENA